MLECRFNFIIDVKNNHPSRRTFKGELALRGMSLENGGLQSNAMFKSNHIYIV